MVTDSGGCGWRARCQVGGVWVTNTERGWEEGEGGNGWIEGEGQRGQATTSQHHALRQRSAHTRGGRNPAPVITVYGEGEGFGVDGVEGVKRVAWRE